MAEGLLRHEGGPAYEVHSAGLQPTAVRPEAIQAMSEIGIDIRGQTSKSVDQFIGQNFDAVITVCDNANERCPVFPGKTERIHKGFEDPPAQGVGSEEYRLNIFRRLRDEMQKWIRQWVDGNG
jgi:arsenate reductase